MGCCTCSLFTDSSCRTQVSCTKALKDWESKEGNPPLAEATVVRIYGGVPYEDGGKVKRAFITKLDNGLNGLKECTYVNGSWDVRVCRRMWLCRCTPHASVMLQGWRSCVPSWVCSQLSLSTNQIDRLIPFGGMQKLKILSLGRNQIKKIEKLEDLSKTLEELWLTYNMITNLDGLASLSKLRVLYVGNNRIKDWGELEKLVCVRPRGYVCALTCAIIDVD